MISICRVMIFIVTVCKTEFSLAGRRVKILNGYENIDRNMFFLVKEERRTGGRGVTLAKKQCRLDIRKNIRFHKEQ